MSASSKPRAHASVSTRPDPADAAAQACEPFHGAAIDLAMVFLSPHHAEHARAITETIHNHLAPACLIGMSAQSVIAGGREFEAGPALAILGLALPSVELVPFSLEDIRSDDPAQIAAALAAPSPWRASILMADPFSVPIVSLLGRLNEAHAGVPLIGAMASAAEKPGQNALILNDRVLDHDAVGVAIHGEIRVDPVVSQGCKPFGPTLVVTESRSNLILRLDGEPALDVVERSLSALPGSDRPLLAHGLCLGRAIHPHKQRLGRDDLLVRNVVGVDQRSRSLAIDDLVAPGQRVRFHLRDRDTARSDLAMLLDAQQLRAPPAAAVLFSCNGRGRAFFNAPDCDARAVQRAFASQTPGEASARGGVPISSEAPPIPLAGCFANGEIGPIAGTSFLHSQSASLALFRAPEDEPADDTP